MSFIKTCLLILLFNIVIFLFLYIVLVIYIYFSNSSDLYEEEKIRLEELTERENNFEFGPVYNLPPEKHYSKKHGKKRHHKKPKHHKKAKHHKK
jgi:hypothetical protein